MDKAVISFRQFTKRLKIFSLLLFFSGKNLGNGVKPPK